jgi:phage I-like protein
MRNGPWFFTVEAGDLETYAQSIRDNPDKIPVDYEHAAQTGRAAGWFTGQAEVRDDRLWAEVQWTPKARQEITDGEYRFISPEFTFNQKDGKTGLMTRAKDIIAAALTNKPAFKELAPVAELLESDEVDAISDLYGSEVADMVLAAMGGDLEKVRAAVWSTAFVNDLPDSSFLHVEGGGTKDSSGTPRSLRHFPVKDASGKVDMPHVRNALSRIPQSSLPANVKAQCTSAAQKMMSNAGGNPSAQLESEAPMNVEETLKALGIDESASVPEKVAAVMKQMQDELLVKSARIAELEAAEGESVKLNDRIAELEVRDWQREVDVLLSKAIDNGQIYPREKDTYAEMFSTSGERVVELKKILASRAPGTAVSRKERGSGGGSPLSFDDPDMVAIASELGIKDDGDPLDADSAFLHMRAMASLKEQGKGSNYTAEEYSAALDDAQRVGVAY